MLLGVIAPVYFVPASVLEYSFIARWCSTICPIDNVEYNVFE